MKNHVYVGSETGFLKAVNAKRNTWRNINSLQNVSRSNEILALTWTSKDQTELCFATRKNTIQVFNVKKDAFTGTHDISPGSGLINNIGYSEKDLLTCTEGGTVKLWKDFKEERVKIDAGPKVCRMVIDPTQNNKFATAGENNLLKVWDLERPEEPVFKAKNVKNDHLDLQVPIWDRDIGFIDNKHVVTCTSYHQIRVYDLSASQRRPVIDMEYEEEPLTALGVKPGHMQTFVGSSKGRMALIDLRNTSPVSTYKGFAGSIRHIVCHPSSPVVASCGLDRYLRIHDVNSTRMKQKIYLKSRLNCLLMTDEWPDDEEKTPSENIISKEAVGEEAEDDLWEDLEPVEDTSTGKRKHEADEEDEESVKSKVPKRRKRKQRDACASS